MHRCDHCGEELTFDWGDYPKLCDLCLRRFYRFQDSWIISRNLRERAQYHRKRREEDGQVETSSRRRK